LINAAYDTCLASIFVYLVTNFRSLGFKKIVLEIIQGFSTGGLMSHARAILFRWAFWSI